MTENEIRGKIRELENLAKKILELKKTALPRRPIVLEFCGTPKSGKTSCLSSLNLFLKRNGFATRLLTERADVCPIQDKFNPLFNIWTANSATAELAAIFTEFGKTLDVIICDRGAFDALCWFEWLLEHDHMKPGDYEAATHYLTTDKFRQMIDLVYLLTASPQVAMEREYAHLLTREHGSIMNPKVLKEINEAIERAEQKYAGEFRCVRTIDTSDLYQNDVSYQVTKDVLETLLGLIVEKVGYFQREDLKRFEGRKHWTYGEFDPPPRLHYGPRDKIEGNLSVVQPVPVLVITNKVRDRILVVKKRFHRVGRGSPEKDKLLVYMGGHIRQEDNLHGPNETLLSVAATTLSREIQEELSLPLNVTDDEPLCIWVKGNKRSQGHLAMAYLYEADFEHISFRLDSFEFVQTTGRSKSGRVLPVADLRPEEMEDWSRIILTVKVGADLQQQWLFDMISEEEEMPLNGP